MPKSLLLALIALAALASPARAQFCPGAAGWVYDDVLASDPFCGYITWMAQNGVSLGCQIIDANHRLYCPNADVTRTQMAAFMNRLTTQPDSTSESVGTITKPGGAFLHNFGVDNTFLGVGAGNFGLNGSGNTAIGSSALKDVSSGGQNTAIGFRALASNTTAYSNTANGAYALAANTTGIANTAVGSDALRDNTSASWNTAMGAYALIYNTTGLNNVATGAGSMASNKTGTYNAAVGAGALHDNVSGWGNTGLGSNAMFNVTGSDNTAVGRDALQRNVAGGQNIAIGAGAAFNLTSGDYNIHIGNSGVDGESHTIRIGDDFRQRTFLAGVRGVTTESNSAVAVVIDGNGQLGTISSSRDAKDDIADMQDASGSLMQLRPVTFHYKADHDSAGRRLQYGLIAEEVAQVYPGMVATKNGKPETVMYQYLPPMLLNEFQKQQRTIEAQAREIERQRFEIASVKATQAREIADLRRAVEVLMARTAGDDRVASR